MHWTRKAARELASLAIQEEIRHHNECTCRCNCDDQISSWVPQDPEGEAIVTDAVLRHIEMEMNGVRRDLDEHYAQSVSLLHSAIGATLGALHHLFSLSYLAARAIRFFPRYLYLQEQKGVLVDLRYKYKEIFDERCEHLGADPAILYTALTEEGRIWSEYKGDDDCTLKDEDLNMPVSPNAQPNLLDTPDAAHLHKQEATRLRRAFPSADSQPFISEIHKIAIAEEVRIQEHSRLSSQNTIDNITTHNDISRAKAIFFDVPYNGPSDRNLCDLLQQSAWERPREG